MARLLSTAKNFAPSSLLALYVFSFWMLPQGWNEDNLLDGSWRYALGKYRELGFSLGRDSWFTYGPIAHWFGAPMGSERFQPLPYYALGLFVAVVIAVAASKILATIDIPFFAKLILIGVFPVSFAGMESVPEVYLIIALLLSSLLCCLQDRVHRVSLIAMVVLAAFGLLYKISFGILALFLLLVILVSLFARGRLRAGLVVTYAVGYFALLYVMFVATSGSTDLLSYLLLGLETSAKYSEIMARNFPQSPPHYLVALVYVAAGGIFARYAARKMPGLLAGGSLVAVYLGVAFLMFKHGFVRADFSHMKLFYSCVTPAIAVLATLSFAGYKAKALLEKVSLWFATLVVLLIYGGMLNLLPGETSPIHLPSNWLTCGNRIVAGVKGESPQVTAAKRKFVADSKPRLFAYLNGYARAFNKKGRKPTITFYPWEVMLFEGVNGFVFAPSPTLQLYTTGPFSRAHLLEAVFLNSTHRPDVVVIGPSAIDGRSPIVELTTLLPPLYAHYRVAAVVDDFTILEVDEPGETSRPVIQLVETPAKAGDFICISANHSQFVDNTLWRLVSTLFKSPELSVVVTITDLSGETLEYVWRGYLSQLQGGVLFSPETVPEFFMSHFRTKGAMAPLLSRNRSQIRSAVALLRRRGGFWNLPVAPRALPLKVEYVSFR